MCTGDHAARLWPYVDKHGPGGCWLWTGGALLNGYGRFMLQSERHHVHRVSYELVKGPIPEGLAIDHICRVRNCVNPDHLRAITKVANTMLGVGPPAVHARKTHCVNGHEFTDENTTRYATGTRRRRCRACMRINARKRRLERGGKSYAGLSSGDRWVVPRAGECTAEGCQRPRRRRGLCLQHHYLMAKDGAPH